MLTVCLGYGTDRIPLPPFARKKFADVANITVQMCYGAAGTAITVKLSSSACPWSVIGGISWPKDIFTYGVNPSVNMPSGFLTLCRDWKMPTPPPKFGMSFVLKMRVCFTVKIAFRGNILDFSVALGAGPVLKATHSVGTLIGKLSLTGTFTFKNLRFTSSSPYLTWDSTTFSAVLKGVLQYKNTDFASVKAIMDMEGNVKFDTCEWIYPSRRRRHRRRRRRQPRSGRRSPRRRRRRRTPRRRRWSMYR